MSKFESRVRLGVFLRTPVPGRVKTRLAAAIGPEGAAQVYAAFVADTLTLASNSSARQVLLFVDGVPGPELRGSTTIAQVEGDLGRRLGAAFERAGAAGPLLVIGSDSPDLPPRHLEAAIGLLDAGAAVVLGPAQDGGVWCIGLDGPRPGFLDDLPWSSPHTGAALGNRARSLGLDLRTAPAWADCDTPADLRALAARLRRAGPAANMTRSWLASTAGRAFLDSETP